MREQILKFRAWDGLNKKFTYWTMNDLCTWDSKDEKPSALDDWQQATGLLDKNGKEIYEGDIFMDEEDGRYDFVIWNSPYGGWSTNQWFSVGEFARYANDKQLEVIGNRYENPDLITH